MTKQTPWLSVLHRQQRTQSDCLAVCVQMVMDYLGFSFTYDQIFQLLGVRSFGAPFRSVKRLESTLLAVTIAHLDRAEIAAYLGRGLPVLVGIHTADLRYWSQSVDHVVVVVGLDETYVYVQDPSLAAGPQAIPLVEFDLAQLGFDYLCAVFERTDAALDWR